PSTRIYTLSYTTLFRSQGQPGRGDHAVSVDGCDVPGVAAGDARAADGRGVGRARSGAADPSRRAGRLRLVSLQHRHAVGLPVVQDRKSTRLNSSHRTIS